MNTLYNSYYELHGKDRNFVAGAAGQKVYCGSKSYAAALILEHTIKNDL